MNSNPVRRATARKAGSVTATVVAAYLPSNYAVTGEDDSTVTIEGRDNAGWTLDDYVIPRLASGLIFASEIPA
jgi:hypothetical protein